MPEILLPEQLAALRSNPPQGAKRLLLAMLEDAVHCFQTYLLARNPHEQRLFQEAEEWLFSDEPQWFFSFEHICELLGFHPGRVHSALKQWKIEQLRLHLQCNTHAGASRAERNTLEPNVSAPHAFNAHGNGKSPFLGQLSGKF